MIIHIFIHQMLQQMVPNGYWFAEMYWSMCTVENNQVFFLIITVTMVTAMTVTMTGDMTGAMYDSWHMATTVKNKMSNFWVFICINTLNALTL